MLPTILVFSSNGFLVLAALMFLRMVYQFIAPHVVGVRGIEIAIFSMLLGAALVLRIMAALPAVVCS